MPFHRPLRSSEFYLLARKTVRANLADISAGGSKRLCWKLGVRFGEAVWGALSPEKNEFYCCFCLKWRVLANERYVSSAPSPRTVLQAILVLEMLKRVKIWGDSLHWRLSLRILGTRPPSATLQLHGTINTLRCCSSSRLIMTSLVL